MRIVINGAVSGDLQFGWTNVISPQQARAEEFGFDLSADFTRVFAPF